MSRQNKVNPGIYTQRGRLTQDDAARELTAANATTARPRKSKTTTGKAQTGKATKPARS